MSEYAILKSVYNDIYYSKISNILLITTYLNVVSKRGRYFKSNLKCEIYSIFYMMNIHCL